MPSIYDPAFIDALAQRRPTPGGGAAAAMTAAQGCALGAMAARYTTGPRWAACTTEAEALAEHLHSAAQRALALAADDARCYQALRQAHKDPASSPDTLAAAAAACAAVPATTITLCADAAQALAAFTPRCNPHLLADAHAALALLHGAAEAAWHILLCNQPDETMRNQAEADRRRCREASGAIRDVAGNDTEKPSS